MAAFDYADAVETARRLYRAAEPTLVVYEEWADFLHGREGRITSQWGEDGLLAALFERLGTRNRWCFEVGAHDGFRLSNTWALRRAGWQAVLIEADDRLFGRLVQLERLRGGTAALVHGRVEPGDLDQVLAVAGAPPDMDLGVIDIDGEDVAVWEAMTVYRPRVMLVEYNPQGDCVRDGTDAWQAGIDTLAAAGRRKGYRILAASGVNGVFVDEQEVK